MDTLSFSQSRAMSVPKRKSTSAGIHPLCAKVQRCGETPCSTSGRGTDRVQRQCPLPSIFGKEQRVVSVLVTNSRDTISAGRTGR